MTESETDRLENAAERIADASESLAADVRLFRDIAAILSKTEATRPLTKGEERDPLAVSLYNLLRQRGVVT
jgi:hypothetical protein